MNTILNTPSPICALNAPLGTQYYCNQAEADQANIDIMEAILWASGWLPRDRNAIAGWKIYLYNAQITSMVN